MIHKIELKSIVVAENPSHNMCKGIKACEVQGIQRGIVEHSFQVKFNGLVINAVPTVWPYNWEDILNTVFSQSLQVFETFYGVS